MLKPDFPKKWKERKGRNENKENKKWKERKNKINLINISILKYIAEITINIAKVIMVKINSVI